MELTNETYKLYEKMILKKVYQSVKSFGYADYDEFVSIGNEIFCKTVNSYDENKGASFSTYLHHNLRDMDNIIARYYKKSSYLCYDNNYSESNDTTDKEFDVNVFQKAIYCIDLSFEKIELLNDMQAQLSEDANMVFNDLINGVFEKAVENIHLGGRKRIFPIEIISDYYGWKHKKTRAVKEEIINWWREYAA